MKFSAQAHFIAAVSIAAFVVALYWWAIVVQPGFGPEFGLFFMLNYNKSLSGLVKDYLNFHEGWYRPTAFNLPYWLGQKFISWHNITAWKVLHLVSLIPTCWIVYALTLFFFPKQHLAGVLAALYLAIYPGMYTIILQSSAFDNTYIIFCIATIIIFIKATEANGKLRLYLYGASTLTYILAITSKEASIAVPLYLGVVATVKTVVSPHKQRLSIVRRYAMMLIPFGILTASYLIIHLRQMPSFGSQGQYRTGFNAHTMLVNAVKFPFWVIRLFAGTGDNIYQTTGLDQPVTTVFALLFFAITVIYWVPELRFTAANRQPVTLLLCWIAVFLLIPIYSGAFLWHVNLSLCAYAVLFGVAASEMINSVQSHQLRWFVAAMLFFAIGVAGIRSSVDTVKRGIHANFYKLNDRRIFQKPPIPPSVLQSQGLVFVEDRFSFGAFPYGGGFLFRLLALNPALDERVVPVQAKVPMSLRAQWLKDPNAYFVRYDDQFRWFDGSSAFRVESVKLISQYTAELLAKGQWKEVIDIVESIRRRQRADMDPDYLLLYHYGYALHQSGRLEQAISVYTESIGREGKFFYSRLNRGLAEVVIGHTGPACEDLQIAKHLNPSHNTLQDSLRRACGRRF